MTMPGIMTLFLARAAAAQVAPADSLTLQAATGPVPGAQKKGVKEGG
jgi:hypothetical protein